MLTRARPLTFHQLSSLKGVFCLFTSSPHLIASPSQSMMFAAPQRKASITSNNSYGRRASTYQNGKRTHLDQENVRVSRLLSVSFFPPVLSLSATQTMTMEKKVLTLSILKLIRVIRRHREKAFVVSTTLSLSPSRSLPRFLFHFL